MGLSNQHSKITPLWVTKLDSKFNCLAVGSVFRESGTVLVSGGEDGSVRIYNVPNRADRVTDILECKSCLESKGGPIQTLTIHDVTRFFSNDVIVGDSRGTLTVFSDGQIVSRQVVSDHVLQCMLVEQDQCNMAILTTDRDGCVIATLPNTILWKLRLDDFPPMKGQRASVQTLVKVSLPNASGSQTNYILASDDERHLYVLQGNTIILMLDTPTNITAMCVGHFVSNIEHRAISGDNSPNVRQVALGGENGGIYIFSNFEIYHGDYGNARLPITKLCTMEGEGQQQLDSILCAGHFNALMVFNDSKCLTVQQTPDWVNSIQTADLDNDGCKEIILGCMDNSVCTYRLQVT